MDIKIPKVEEEKQPEIQENSWTESVKIANPPSQSEYVGIEYERKYMDMVNDDDWLWTEEKGAHNDPLSSNKDGSGSPNHVKFIDYDFYDKYIVDYNTGKWLADDTVWVIGMTAPIAYDSQVSDHIYGLIMRTIRILNDHFYQGNDKVRFGVVN